MASSSTSSVPKSFLYDVFLSFRGEDTRNNFVADLHSALKGVRIITYKDDENMMRGERISDELIRAIENSRFYVIVFSKNYASSSWCLDELAKIMECQQTSEQKAYPVFYHVEPTQVRNQSGAFGEAFEKNKMKEDAGKWRKALSEAAGLAGFGLEDTNGDEAKLINEVVENILQELPSIKFSDVEKFIGMEDRVEKVVPSSSIGSNEVHMIGIKGMGGAGKTTLAKAIYDKYSHRFSSKRFVENVREKVSKDSSGLKSLQEQVLSDMSKGNINVHGESDGKLQMKRRMYDKAVLLVLDDVDNIKQLEALAEPSWFRPGSIIVITTRDEGVLIKHRVDSVHDVKLLSREEAIRLFSWHAFRTEIPIPGYEKLSHQVVDYAAGLPLTIRVLGSDLVGKDELEWEDTIERLKEIPPIETLQQLELSYMGLEADYKVMFLDVACFWKGWPKEHAIIPLQCCQLRAITGLKVLERKSLITVSKYGILGMHDSIQEMGWDIVRRDHRDEPERHSRLWIRDEIEYILTNDLGNESTRGIRLFDSTLSPSIIMKGLKKMKKLRLLYVALCVRDNMDLNDREFDAANGYLPNTLQYLSWFFYPFTSLPLPLFQESNLSGLSMYDSNLVHLWQGGKGKALKKLRFLDFHGSCSKTLDHGFCPNLETTELATIDLEGAPNLESLRISYASLEKLRMPAKLPKLKSLTISGESSSTIEKSDLIQNSKLVKIKMPAECPKLESREHPMLGILSSLQRRDESIACRMVIECPSLQSLDLRNAKLKTLNLGMTPFLESITLHDPGPALNLKNLNLEERSQLKKIMILKCSELFTLDLGLSPNLEDLSLEYCSDLVQVCMRVGHPSLRFLNLKHLPKLRTLDTAMTPNLEKLVTLGCYQLQLEKPLICSKLKFLHLIHLLKLRTLMLQTPNVEECLVGCSNLLELKMLDKCPKLETLTISCSKLRTFNFAQTPNLIGLNLEGCDHLELQMPLKFSKLNIFKLSGSMQKTLRLETPNLEDFSLSECPRLEMLSIPCSNLRTFNLAQTPNLKELILRECYNLAKLHAPIACLGKIRKLYLHGCSRFKTFEFLNKFEDSDVDAFPELKVIVESVDTSDDYFPNVLGWLGHLEDLTISSKDVKHLPDSICMLKLLKYLKLESCWHLEKLPQDLGQLECLETLNLSDCRFLRDIPKSICQMKCLKYLHLSYCFSLKELPVELGHLASLEELRVEGTGGIRHLPQSIFRLQGLSIIGSDWLLLLWGLTPQEKISEYVSRCRI